MRNIFLLLLASFIYSCSDTPLKKVKNQAAENLIVNVDQAGTFVMSKFFKSIEYIPLQTPKDRPIGNITKIVVSDRLIFLFDETKKSIWIVTPEGKLIREISIPEGNGPGELFYMADFTIHNSTNQISILGSYKIAIYTIKGEHVRDIIVSHPAYKFRWLGDQYVLFASNSLYQNADIDNTGSNLIFINSEGNILETALPIDTRKRGLGLIPFESFPVYDKYTLFYGHMDDRIYQIEDSAVSVRYTVDFREYAVPDHIYDERENYRKKSDFFEKEIVNRGSAFFLSSVIETDQIVYFNFLTGQDPKQVFYNKDQKESYVVEKLVNDLDYGLSPIFRATHRGNLYTLIQPYDLIERVKSIRKNYPQYLQGSKMDKIKRLTADLSGSDNPIIMKAEVGGTFHNN